MSAADNSSSSSFFFIRNRSLFEFTFQVVPSSWFVFFVVVLVAVLVVVVVMETTLVSLWVPCSFHRLLSPMKQLLDRQEPSKNPTGSERI